MGKPRLFVINLASNISVYFSGSNVEGSVSLELSEAEKTQGISIVFSGKAYVHWTESARPTTGSDRSGTVYHNDTQIIFHDISKQLWGDDKDSQELAAGRYEFPFKFQLPSDRVLPSSFESRDTGYIDGYIRYLLLARIKRSSKFDYTTSASITVNEIVDINTRQLTVPLSRSNEKTLCCLCCASGPISLSVKTDRGGYCPGESIAISTEVENHSKRRITCVRATLKQKVVYRAGGNSITRYKVIQKIENYSSSNWSNKLLRIPATVPSINSCHVLNLSYTLTVTLDIPRAIDLHVTIPITIGNVPFKGGEGTAYSQVESYQPVGSFPTTPVLFAPSDPYPPPVAMNLYTPVGPPGGNFNYSAAHAPVNIGPDNYTMGETQYAPLYGFVSDYRFVPPPSYAEATINYKVKGEED